mgnify:CR=1 FL=1
MDINELKRTLSDNHSNLAFIVGNGINRYAFGNAQDTSWNGLLLKVWRKISDKPLTNISQGISLTEFYNIMELEAGSINRVRNEVVETLNSWQPVDYHKWLQDKIVDLDVPLLTTNFDKMLEFGLNQKKIKSIHKIGFTDYYPWNVYSGEKELEIPTEGFGVWHINGMIDYRRSIRLGLSEYIALSSRVRSYLHGSDGLEIFDIKNQAYWKGYNTWLHIIFNSSLCIFGLALDENETFLRWLLIERAKYFNKFPERKKNGWYVCKSNGMSDGKKIYLDYVGIEIVFLDNYTDIYEGIFDF